MGYETLILSSFIIIHDNYLKISAYETEAICLPVDETYKNKCIHIIINLKLWMYKLW
jgi:hypothetical protein